VSAACDGAAGVLKSPYSNFQQWHRQCVGESCDQNSTDESSLEAASLRPALQKIRAGRFL
jgi:hypothetical protein